MRALDNESSIINNTDMGNMSFFLIPAIGLILMVVFLTQKKEESWSRTVLLALGIFTLGYGATQLNYAGSINALLIQQTPEISTDLHDALDPALWAGFINLTVGSILIAVSRKK